MNTQLKYILGIVGAVIVGVGIGYFMFRSRPQLVGGSNLAPGTINNVARIAQIAGNGTATSTWFSMLNTDANDRIVLSVDIAISGTSGVGSTSAELVQCATSTEPYDLNSNSNYTFNTTLNALGTAILSYNSYTSLASTSVAHDWAAGSYMNCVAGASGVANSGLTTATTTEEIRIPYIPL
jgi:hypothetical protein